MTWPQQWEGLSGLHGPSQCEHVIPMRINCKSKQKIKWDGILTMSARWKSSTKSINNSSFPNRWVPCKSSISWLRHSVCSFMRRLAFRTVRLAPAISKPKKGEPSRRMVFNPNRMLAKRLRWHQIAAGIPWEESARNPFH